MNAKVYKISLIATLILSQAACSKVGFGTKSSSSSSSAQSVAGNDAGGQGGNIGNEIIPDRGQFPVDPLNPGKCTSTLSALTRPVKLLFVVDQSGSNAENTLTAAVGDGTDPNKVFRVGSLQGFVDRFQSKSNFSWGLITFQDLKNAAIPLAKALINNGGNTQAPKFSSAADMNSAISVMQSTADNGYTPYKASIQLARTALAGDPNLHDANQAYAIVFITDGMPTDYVRCVNNASGLTTIEGTGACPGQIAVVDDDALLADVRTTVSPTSLITFNTVYYGANDTNKANSIYRLQQMATAGHGQFVDASSVSTIKIEDSIQIPGVTCP